MLTREYAFTENDFPIDSCLVFSIIHHHSEIKNGVFFDIETTGFSASKNALYLIGCCWYETDHWKLIQWLASNPSDDEQIQVIEHFFECISNFDTIISFNGSTFDLPFIDRKCRQLKLNKQIYLWNHIDLFTQFRPLKNILKLDNMKLKTIEKFLGINRDDIYSGGALIPIYETYTISKSDELLELLFLHNYEDIKDMLFVLPLYAYIHLTIGEFSIISSEYDKNKNRFLTILQTDIPVPQPVHYQCVLPVANQVFYIDTEIDKNIVKLNIPVFTGTLKHFFNNPKDYYYLPLEDYAIHKSVAEFVDKSVRQKANHNNCYIKKEGTYLPQKLGTLEPSFKFNCKDTMDWIEFNDNLFKKEKLESYIQSLLQAIILNIFN